jgi:hypothetical protein
MRKKRKPVACCLLSVCSTYRVRFRYYPAQGQVGITCLNRIEKEAFVLVKPLSFFRLVVEGMVAHVLREGGEMMDAWILIPFSTKGEPTVEIILSLEKLSDFIDEIDIETGVGRRSLQ